MAIKTIAQFRTEATSEIESAKPLFAQINNERREFTDEEYTQAIEDLANSKLDTQDNGYIKARQEAYASIGDQLDMQYKDLLNDTTTWKDHIAQVKSDNPKPS